MRHGNVRVLDFSWNSIGTFRGKLFATQLCELLSTQHNLIHLDMCRSLPILCFY